MFFFLFFFSPDLFVSDLCIRKDMWKDIYYGFLFCFFSPDLFVSDLCNDADPDEVEILSLIQEQIPRYRLRADSVSDFGGYSHQDWIQTPLINLDTDLDLTDLQIAESLKYFSECFTVACYLFAVCNLCNKFLHATAWAAQILYTLFNPFELIRSAHTVLCNFMSGWFSTVEPLINPTWNADAVQLTSVSLFGFVYWLLWMFL